MSALLAPFWPYIFGLIVALLAGAGWKLRQSGYDSAVKAQKAKEADAYAKHLQDIANAGNARPAGSVSDDPNNRDR